MEDAVFKVQLYDECQWQNIILAWMEPGAEAAMPRSARERGTAARGAAIVISRQEPARGFVWQRRNAVYCIVRRMRIALALAAALLTAAAVCLAQTAAGLEGIWLTEDGTAKIRFEPCGPGLCGRLVWLLEPNDPQTGRAILDKHNPDPALRNRQLLGIALFTDVTPLRSGEWHAIAYNAENAGSYDVTLTLTAPNALALRGCGLAGLVCRTESWTRAAP